MTKRAVAGVLLLGLLQGGGGLVSGERIQVWPESRWYWQYQGKPVLLLGGSDEDNLFNHPEMSRANLETLQEVGGNYIRQTLSCRDEGNVWPFRRTDGKYDLDGPNPEFWDRLANSCRDAYERDVIVQIEFWATFDFYRDNWLKNPWNPANNVNYTTETTRLVPEWDHHPSRKAQPFFYSVPELNDDAVLLEYQQEFVRKVLEVTVDLPNVLYCLDNETATPPEWCWYWGRFLAEESRKRGVPIQVTEMWDAHDIRTEQHSHTYEHPEIFSYVDVSQNNWQIGQTHYDRLMWMRRTLGKQAGGIRPMNNDKVYARLGRESGLVDISLDRWWQNVFAGCASTRFHRPTGGSGIGLGAEAQHSIRAARTFTDAFDIFHTEPHPELLSDRQENEAYCLARPGEVYALYFPKGGAVRLKTGHTENQLELRWFDPTTARFADPRPLEPGGEVVLESPSREHTWLALIR